ncbi:hypothetical protein sscle_02g015070 [Sclerotinia sclerotiorum 1980 UF-70]|uniref:Methyltransferase type 11 domain-containing protein n=1 Tax=Sclerotinia sclerotiorum (strain ATCC 18683 / 1980 / Ss-1) TaxID=665079 RepID=A0A1D9PVL7_SCLS1|nr:hypothetical protein sscle_02g015070 [Sclerotinia sclerotiorum 1980 UF-70]
MDKFWAQAARALKPGGTVALWTRGSTLSSFYPHPSTPNRKQLLQIFTNLEHKILAPYELPANRLSRDMYDHLPLPWNIPHPIPASTFPPWQFLKLDFDREGILSDAKSNDFFGGGREVTLKDVEETLGTANMVTRWREAHAEKAETEEDILKLHIEEVRKVMGGKESMLVGSSTAIIFVKKAIEEA